MKPAERFALDQWLFSYPDGKTYEEIIAEMQHFANEWTIENFDAWQVVENFTMGQVAEFIEDTRMAFERALLDLGIVTTHA